MSTQRSESPATTDEEVLCAGECERLVPPKYLFDGRCIGCRARGDF